jgi:glycosyltransferase involved in cell wall biosynthesis
MKFPKVLIFTPTYSGKDYALEKFLSYANEINYPNFRHIFIDNSKDDEYFNRLVELGLDAHRVERGNSSREALARSQNYARKIALEEGYDYIMSLESDIYHPPNIVQLLLRHGKQVITAFYCIGEKSQGVRIPCITQKYFNEETGLYGTRLLPPDEWGKYFQQGVKQVIAGGMGCCLIHKTVFKKFGFYYEPTLRGHSDVWFFQECSARGIPVFVDTDVVLDHDNVSWSTVEDR